MNTVFKLEQPDPSLRIQLLMDVTLPCESDGSGDADEVTLSVTEEDEVTCVMVKECGISFGAEHTDPIPCRDQGQGDSKDLGLAVHFG